MYRLPIVLLALAVLTSGCGVKLAYNNLDRFARWGVSDYVDMNDEQRAYFDAEIASILYWHRIEHLPQYAELFESMEKRFADGTNTGEIVAIGDQFFSWYEEFEDRLLPVGIEMLLSLTDEQVTELPERLVRDSEEIAEDEEELSLEESQERWQREYMDGISRFTGKLNTEQKAYLSEQSARYIPQYRLWAQYRLRWGAAVMQLLLDDREDAEVFDKAMRELVALRVTEYYGGELTAVFEHNELLYQEVTVWLINHLTAKQQQRLAERTRELAEAFRELVAEAPAAPPVQKFCLVRC